tara:strand:+ start:116 stop:319 length:204 start_codon:yes stop_codon:yes gene_type:complete
MTSHYLYITTPDDVTEEDICEHWRDFDGGDFSTEDDGDWEYSDIWEVEKDEIDSFHVEWDKDIEEEN